MLHFGENKKSLQHHAKYAASSSCAPLNFQGDRLSNSPSELESSYLRPDPGVRDGQHQRMGFFPRIDSILRLLPRSLMKKGQINELNKRQVLDGLHMET